MQVRKQLEAESFHVGHVDSLINGTSEVILGQLLASYQRLKQSSRLSALKVFSLFAHEIFLLRG